MQCTLEMSTHKLYSFNNAFFFIIKKKERKKNGLMCQMQTGERQRAGVGSDEEEKRARHRVTLISQEANEMRQYLVC